MAAPKNQIIYVPKRRPQKANAEGTPRPRPTIKVNQPTTTKPSGGTRPTIKVNTTTTKPGGSTRPTIKVGNTTTTKPSATTTTKSPSTTTTKPSGTATTTTKPRPMYGKNKTPIAPGERAYADPVLRDLLRDQKKKGTGKVRYK